MEILCVSARGTGCVKPRRNPRISLAMYRPAIYAVTKRKRKPGYYWKFHEDVGKTKWNREAALALAKEIAEEKNLPFLGHVRHQKGVTLA